jgi:hypothetical protein
VQNNYSKLSGTEQMVITSSTPAEAYNLWQSDNWSWYEAQRQVLLKSIRAGRVEQVRLPQLQYIYFVETHLRPLFNEDVSDRELFQRHDQNLIDAVIDLMALID